VQYAGVDIELGSTALFPHTAHSDKPAHILKRHQPQLKRRFDQFMPFTDDASM
jgi:hypothetical protein